MTGVRRGRRAGGVDTRGAILAAARQEFAAHGYDRASVRGIARAAGVDPSLVHHYFDGGKEQVFLAAMELPVDPATAVPALVAGPHDGLGERLVRFMLSVWGDPRSRTPFLALLRSATTSEAGALLLRQFVTRALLARIAATLDLPDRELRVEAAAAQLVGLALLRYVVRVEPLASASDDEVVALVAPTVQRYLSP
ncbi:TetR family transcriptional regulator [Vallicoccus soli]|uniref:TetR/AcrR family transcriptional regulator n=1 Tax=Vallicoccus soli TaxID=2339232 RepID=A0A3A3ZJX3_9ACTN|nr:TetR family transcriptional regulator [Vallicoccus soli]RJK96063.1 TetR/AcrR family transcriptional regulator [Vallicoccus soli]